MTRSDVLLALGYLVRDGGGYCAYNLPDTVDDLPLLDDPADTSSVGLVWDHSGTAPTLADLETNLDAAKAWAATL